MFPLHNHTIVQNTRSSQGQRNAGFLGRQEEVTQIRQFIKPTQTIGSLRQFLSSGRSLKSIRSVPVRCRGWLAVKGDKLFVRAALGIGKSGGPIHRSAIHMRFLYLFRHQFNSLSLTFPFFKSSLSSSRIWADRSRQSVLLFPFTATHCLWTNDVFNEPLSVIL